jgi:hypothetical protein
LHRQSNPFAVQFADFAEVLASGAIEDGGLLAAAQTQCVQAVVGLATAQSQHGVRAEGRRKIESVHYECDGKEELELVMD